MNKAGSLPSPGVMLSLGLKRYYEPLRLPVRPVALSFPYTAAIGSLPAAVTGLPCCTVYLHNMPPLLPRESMRATSVIPAFIQRPSPLDHRVGFSICVTRLRLGSLALRPAASPLGNLRYPITRTPLPGAKKVYGQLLSRNFNPLDIPPITANGLTPLILDRAGAPVFRIMQTDLSTAPFPPLETPSAPEKAGIPSPCAAPGEFPQ